MSNIKEDLRNIAKWIGLQGRNTNLSIGTLCGLAAERLGEIENDVDQSLIVLEMAMEHMAENTFPGDSELFSQLCEVYKAVKDVKDILRGKEISS